MRKIVLFIILSITLLIADESIDSFIDKQIEVEIKLLDGHLQEDEKKSLKKAQKSDYREFFLSFASKKQEFLNTKSPYRYKINNIKIRLKNSIYQKDKYYSLYNKINLKEYLILDSIDSTLKDVLRETSSRSKEFFEDKINEIIVKYFLKFKPLDTAKITVEDMNLSDSEIDSLSKAVKRYIGIESVANTFSSKLIESSSTIYKTVTLSESKVLSKLNELNDTQFGQNINDYLLRINLDLAKVTLVIVVIIIILLIQLIVRYLVKYILNKYNLKESDIEYIQVHITRVFNIITTLFIIHLIFVVNLGIDSKSINITKLFSILYVILTALLIYRVINTIFFLKMEGIKSSKMVKNEVINLIIKIINTLIVVIATIAILKIFNVNLTALLSGLGIAGAAVAFAAKDTISNIFGSISILIGNVFEQGDWIETSDVDGTVVEIGLRASTIRTFDNALISIPNFELANKSVKNWSRRRIGRRIKMHIGVTYESDFDDIRVAIEEIKEMLKEHTGVADEHTAFLDADREARLVSRDDFKGIKRTTLVYLDEFSDSSINILLYCFSRSVVWSEWLEVKEDIMYKIAEILKRNNLEFAYPTMTLHQQFKNQGEDDVNHKIMA